MADFQSIQHAMWDRFIDALDTAGQAGRMAEVAVPPLAIDLPAGQLFGELTRVDVQNLSKQAKTLGRREDVIVTMWEDMQRRKKPTRRKGLQAKPTGREPQQ